MHNILVLITLYSELNYTISVTFNNCTVRRLTFDFLYQIKRLELNKHVECNKMGNNYAIYIHLYF